MLFSLWIMENCDDDDGGDGNEKIGMIILVLILERWDEETPGVCHSLLNMPENHITSLGMFTQIQL